MKIHYEIIAEAELKTVAGGITGPGPGNSDKDEDKDKDRGRGRGRGRGKHKEKHEIDDDNKWIYGGGVAVA